MAGMNIAHGRMTEKTEKDSATDMASREHFPSL